MSVSNGQPATATVFNNAFGSKQSDNTYTGKQTLNRVGSGPEVNDVQQSINNSFWQTNLTEEISNGGTVSSDNNNRFQYRRVQADSVATHTLDSSPFGSGGAWSDGIVIRLVGIDNDKKIRINNSDTQYGAILNGDVELGKYSSLDLQYDSVLERWLEVGRSV